MAKITLNPMIQKLSGKMGNVVYRMLPNGQTTVTKLADMSNVKWSAAQKAQASFRHGSLRLLQRESSAHK